MAAFLGTLLLCAGGLLALVGFARPIAVGGTVNLGLMCDRICLLIAAGALWIMGAVFLASSMIAAAVSSQRYRRD